MRIFSKPFFTNYIVHPLSKDLTRGERAKALISSIAIGIFSLGICQAVCAVKFHNRRTEQYTSKVIVYCESEYEKERAGMFLKRLCPHDYRLMIEFTKDVTATKGDNQRVLAVYSPTMVATELEVENTNLGVTTDPREHRKTMILVNNTQEKSPRLRGPGWEYITKKESNNPYAQQRIIAFFDSATDDDIKEFFAPFAEEATGQNGEE